MSVYRLRVVDTVWPQRCSVTLRNLGLHVACYGCFEKDGVWWQFLGLVAVEDAALSASFTWSTVAPGDLFEEACIEARRRFADQEPR